MVDDVPLNVNVCVAPTAIVALDGVIVAPPVEPPPLEESPEPPPELLAVAPVII